jgi:Protein involved in formate dehydrogenase formation
MVPSENGRIKIDRARLLARKFPESAHLLELYIQLVELQEDPNANESHLRAIVPFDPDTEDRARFYRRVLTRLPGDRSEPPADGNGPICPSCGSKPVVGVLRGEGEGAKRSLICSLCALEWPYRRVICVNCGEEDKEKLPVYLAAQIEHVRVEACDSCRTYLKSVDLTKDGFAVPEVDEIATVTLNLWADEHDYAKVETNLLGM